MVTGFAFRTWRKSPVGPAALIKIPPRRSAWEFLRDAERNDSYLNLAINDLYRQLEPRDRAFVTELVFGSVRMRKLIDHVIDQLADRAVDDATRSLLRLSLYEALLMRTAEHAVVNEYVEIAKQVIGRARSGFINAIMRRALRERDSLMDPKGVDLATRTSHPQWIVDAYRTFLAPDDLELELLSHNKPGGVSVVSFEELDAVLASPSGLTPHGYRSLVPPGDIPAIRESKAFVQDEGSQVLCEIALATDKDRSLNWLDLCAGPGGKFAYLAHWLPPDHLVGNELHPHRAELIRSRAPHHKVSVGDGRLFEAMMPFDRIVIDAPCTGIGALRRRPDARWRRTESDLKELILLQRGLLNHAAEILAPGGIIFYMTCSPHPLETRAQVSEFLITHPSFELLPISQQLLSSINNSKIGDSIGHDGSLQLFTKDLGTDAMFMAMLRKRDDA